ncbi:MAG: electron transfer flavoprotein subunit beta/FixA family protein [Sarcina sp.]|jgi:electron transfer flavoprotein beta subunit|uniref:electron transfer flavoprotein subunit beta/FixA family protein n=1 Tax=Sarcina sp. DSM 11001 TaxID=1798184 RepID=UPI000890BAF1|nr:electron transfer flavoprotein subunit beta/FixA family protein [Sarcina sp. DSM 11001]MBE6000027.1 electron transfer flavoprotein subunit beta/FixA family protein [Sarcina sp.]MEE1040159.1 electron transfer flavoprotein subunit beta/FixA family protein [Lachnospiraceae bacterium]SDL07695.1 electron transfer flavoprotein beta subunit [Sarcina sp. DSM 11001]
MNILVCVKQVPDTTMIKIDPVKHTLIREGVPAILNPFDGYALEAAARIKDKNPGTKITVVTMGPPQAKAVLKECIGIAADKGYLVTGRTFGGSDTLATSYILSHAIKKIEETEGKFDAIFCGKQAIDGDTAQVGPEIAEWLDLPQVTYGLECFEDGDGLKVNKEIDGGYEVIGIKCPCLVTFTMPSFECRYPTIKRKLMANKAKFEELGDDFDPTMDAAHYGLNGSPTHVKRSFTPPVKEGGMKIKEETGEDSAKVLAKILVDKGIV